MCIFIYYYLFFLFHHLIRLSSLLHFFIYNLIYFSGSYRTLPSNYVHCLTLPSNSKNNQEIWDCEIMSWNSGHLISWWLFYQINYYYIFFDIYRHCLCLFFLYVLSFFLILEDFFGLYAKLKYIRISILLINGDRCIDLFMYLSLMNKEVDLYKLFLFTILTENKL